MPIPALDANGLLPPGVHEASIEEVRELGPLVDFFAQVKGDPTLRKGMVRVTL